MCFRVQGVGHEVINVDIDGLTDAQSMNCMRCQRSWQKRSYKYVKVHLDKSMEHNVLTGTTSARLHKLVLKNKQGTYQNILDLMATNDDLMQIYIAGVLYSNVAAINLTNPQFYMDSASGILNIGTRSLRNIRII